MEVLVRQVSTAGPWTLVIYGKEHKLQIFLDNRLLCF